MKQKLYYRLMVISLVGVGMFLFSCRTDVSEPYGEKSNGVVEINTRVTGAVEGENDVGTARLLFWEEDEFHNKWIATGSGKPRNEVSIPEELNNYNYGKRVFSTGILYPTADASLHVTGYAPDDALRPDKKKGYSLLNVEEKYREGKTDFLSCDGNSGHLGSTKSPFTLEEHELRFRHLTACISFKAARGKKMIGKVGVRNVKIVVEECNKLEIPISFEIFQKPGEEKVDDQSTYRVKDLQLQSEITIDQRDDNYIRQDEEKEIGACYILDNWNENYDPFVGVKEGTGEKSLTISVSADYYLITRGTNGELDYQFLREATWESRNVLIETKTGNQFYPGYRYDVLITFNSDEILLEGKSVAWEDGGEHYLPVFPQEKQ